MRKVPPSSEKKSIYRVLIVEGVEVIRVGLAQIISAASQLLVCAATGDYDDAPTSSNVTART